MESLLAFIGVFGGAWLINLVSYKVAIKSKNDLAVLVCTILVGLTIIMFPLTYLATRTK
jgi:hypothetical protein